MRKWIVGTALFLVVPGILATYIIKTHGKEDVPNNTRNQTATTATGNVASLSPTGKPTLPEKKQVFEQVWDLFAVYYPNFQMKGIDWSEEKKKYEPDALRASTWTQFFSVTSEMINDLRDGHSKFIGAPQPPMYVPFIATAWWNGHMVVTWSNGDKQIPVGSIITSINGEPALTSLSSLKYSAAAAAQDALITTVNKPEQLSLFVPSSNQNLNVTVPVYPIGDPDDPTPNKNLAKLKQVNRSSWAVKPGIAYGNPIANVDGAFRIAHLQNDVLYVYIPTMTLNEDESMKEFQSVLQLAGSAKGIIVDIRGNYGGDMWPGLWFSRHLYTKIEEPVEIRFPLSVYNQLPDSLVNMNHQKIPVIPVSPMTKSNSFTNWGKVQLTPLKPTIHVPVALLTNDLNFSAAENFTSFMDAAPNVKTFGGTTGGSDGSPGTFPVMKGVQVEVPTWQERITATGLPIEGFGLQPDYPVYISDKVLTEEIARSENGDIQQVMARDPVLHAAQNWIGRNLK